MRTKIVFVLNIIVIAATAAIIVWQLAFAEEKDVKLIVKAATLFIIYTLGIIGVKRKKSVFDYKIYEERYDYIIKNAFCHDKVNYMRLMNVITLYNEDKFDKAILRLDKLEEASAEVDDFSAVLYFRALCKDESGNKLGAAADYEELLTRDYTHSHAWSNLGLIYAEVGRTDDAFRAYHEAVGHNPSNHFAHCNLGNLYLEQGDYQSALQHALEALKSDPKLLPSISLAAFSYGKLGDNDNAEKYCELYGRYGGDASQLRKVMLR